MGYDARSPQEARYGPTRFPRSRRRRRRIDRPRPGPPLGGRAPAPEIPTVDRLVLTSIVDNVYDIFAPAGRRGTIRVERTPFAMTSGTPLVAEHGLALHLESHRGAERREVLLDFGLTAETLARTPTVASTSTPRGRTRSS